MTPPPFLLKPRFNTIVGGSDRTQDKSHGKTINAAAAACQERVYHAGDRLVMTQHIAVQLDTIVLINPVPRIHSSNKKKKTTLNLLPNHRANALGITLPVNDQAKVDLSDCLGSGRLLLVRCFWE